jgi:hypothetical protein
MRIHCVRTAHFSPGRCRLFRYDRRNKESPCWACRDRHGGWKASRREHQKLSCNKPQTVDIGTAMVWFSRPRHDFWSTEANKPTSPRAHEPTSPFPSSFHILRPPLLLHSLPAWLGLLVIRERCPSKALASMGSSYQAIRVRYSYRMYLRTEVQSRTSRAEGGGV